MPKKKSFDNMELEFLRWKNKKLQRELDRKHSLKRKKRNCSLNSSRDRDRSRSPLRDEDHSRSSSRDSRHKNTGEDTKDDSQVESDNPNEETLVKNTDTEMTLADETTSTAGEVILMEEPMPEAPDMELLEILGVDPSTTVEYGKDIHLELSSRLQHIATVGLTKETRMELNNKYLIPANSIKIGAPSMNPEIKAAITEVVMKRDKGIEARQKQLAAAISGLAMTLHNELESKNKDCTRSKQLMDVCRILCDIQHAHSVTRRNFAIFSIKKDLKEHLINTKIDKTLFGEDLAETLKSAKAVTKSGTELKTKPPPKPKAPIPTSNLNWKSPAPARKQPQQVAPRGRDPAPQPAPGPPPRYTRSTQPASSYKTSCHPPKQNRRR